MGVGVNWGDVPTWVAAIGTVGTLTAALLQINTERRRRLQQEKEDRVERHRAQARLVAAILGREEPAQLEGSGIERRTAVDLVNGSDEPAYRLVVGIVFLQGAGPRSMEEWLEFQRQRDERRDQPPGDIPTFTRVPVITASILPPKGVFRVWIPGVGWSAILSGRSGAEVAFTDRAGAHWIRRAGGLLEELPEDPIDYFHRRGFYSPYELYTPERVG